MTDPLTGYQLAILNGLDAVRWRRRRVGGNAGFRVGFASALTGIWLPYRKHVYQGTVPAAAIARRRAHNRRAGASRRINRGQP